MINNDANILLKVERCNLNFTENLLCLRIKSALTPVIEFILLKLSRNQVGTKSAPGWHQVVTILDFCKNPQSMQAIMEKAEWKDRTKFRNKYINLFSELELIQMTIPDKPNSSKQQYRITEKGNLFLKLLKNE